MLTLRIVVNVHSGFRGLKVTGSSPRPAHQGWRGVPVLGLSDILGSLDSSADGQNIVGLPYQFLHAWIPTTGN